MDTEVLPQTKGLMVCVFSPGKTGLVRLDAEAGKYNRWSLNRVTISYEPTSAMTNTNTITMGILPGKKDETVKDAAAIMKLRPFIKQAVWKGSSLTVTRSIMPQQYLYCSGDGKDDVAFGLYIFVDDATVGVVKISYDISLTYPKP